MAKSEFYQKLLSSKYKPKSKSFKGKLFAHKLATLSAKMTAIMKQESQKVDKFIQKIDQNIEATEHLFQYLEAFIIICKEISELMRI